MLKFGVYSFNMRIKYQPKYFFIFLADKNIYFLFQPYRTTPLVLPGAKIKKDAPLGECYLRHHPNPMIRAAPHHYEVAHPEVAMKQKVQTVGRYSREFQYYAEFTVQLKSQSDPKSA